MRAARFFLSCPVLARYSGVCIWIRVASAPAVGLPISRYAVTKVRHAQHHICIQHRHHRHQLHHVDDDGDGDDGDEGDEGDGDGHDNGDGVGDDDKC